MSFKKGDIIRVVGGWNRYTYGYQRLTQQEKIDWYKSDDAKGLTDDGESKIAPSSRAFRIDDGEEGIVLNGKKTKYSDYSKHTGILVFLTNLNMIVYIHPENLIHVRTS